MKKPAAPSSEEAAKQQKIVRSIFGNAAVLLGGKGVNGVLALGYLAFAARSLGAAQFGVLVLIQVYAQTISEITKFQSWQVVIHYGNGPLGRGEIPAYQQVLRFSLVLDLFSAVIGVVVAIVGVAFCGDLMDWPPDARVPAMLYMTSVAFMVTSTPTGILRLIGRFDLLAIRTGGGAVTRFLGAALGWWLHADLAMFLLIWYVANLAGFITLFGSGFRQSRLRGHLQDFPLFGGPLTPPYKGIWRFALSTNFNSTVAVGFGRLPLLAIGGLLGPTQAALFRIASQLANSVNKPAKLLVPAMYPEMARMKTDKDWRGLRAVSWKISLACGTVSAAMVVIVWLFGAQGMAFFMGEEFRAGGTIVTLMAVSSAINIWAMPLEPLLISINKAGTALGVRTGVTIAGLPLIYVLTERYGLNGTGGGFIVISLVMLLVQLLPVLAWFRKRERRSAEAEAREASKTEAALPPQ